MQQTSHTKPKHKLSFQEFHQITLTKNYLTPDQPLLNEYENHYVFVYGTLMRDHCRQGILNPRDCLGYAKTTIPVYTMHRYAYGNYPVVTYAAQDWQKGQKILGELYLVATPLINRLDQIEANGHLFKRRSQQIECRGQKVFAHMYIGIPSAFNTQDLDRVDIHYRRDGLAWEGD